MRFEFYNPSPDVAAKAATLRAEMAGNRLLLASIRLARLLVKYNPDQPRVPAGSADGGRWTAGGEEVVRVAENDRGSKIGTDASVTRSKRKGTTPADEKAFVDKHRAEAQKLADALGDGADAKEFLALSSVESRWGTYDTVSFTNNYFGLHNDPAGPYPGQIGTYVSPGTEGSLGQTIPHWIPPYPPSSPHQAVAIFSEEAGYADSGAEVVRRLKKAGGDYSSPSKFFATIRARGWAAGSDPSEYVRTLLQRYRHVSRY